MNRRARYLLFVGVIVIGASAFWATAASVYHDPLGRFTLAVPPGWTLNPISPDAMTTEFTKGLDRLSVCLVRQIAPDAAGEADRFAREAGSENPTVTPADPGNVRLSYSVGKTDSVAQVICRDGLTFVLRLTSPAPLRNPGALDPWLKAFQITPGTSIGPSLRHWTEGVPILYRDPRGKFTASIPPFWVLTVRNRTQGDASYTTRFEEMGGNGSLEVVVYPGRMGDLMKHMAGWTDSLARDSKYPGLKVLSGPGIVTLGKTPAGMAQAEYDGTAGRRNLRLILATLNGTNCMVMLDYGASEASTFDGQLSMLIRSVTPRS